MMPATVSNTVRVVLPALMLAALLAATDMMVVNVAMYSIIRDLDPANGLRDSQWVLTVYMLALGGHRSDLREAR
jgi:MFS family permease